MIYGKSNTLDVDRVIDMLQALEKFVAVKDFGDGKAFKVNGKRGSIPLSKNGEILGTKKLIEVTNSKIPVTTSVGNVITVTKTTKETISLKKTDSNSNSHSNSHNHNHNHHAARQALIFFFSKEGDIFQDFLLEEICNGLDALSREAIQELILRLGINDSLIPPIFKALAPKLNDSDRKIIDSILKLVNFFVSGDTSRIDFNGNTQEIGILDFLVNRNTNNIKNSKNQRFTGLVDAIVKPENQAKFNELLPLFREFAPNMRTYGLRIVSRLIEKGTARMLRATADVISINQRKTTNELQTKITTK